MNFNNSKLFSTHNPMLIKYVQATDGPVLECGVGMFSTPLLHWLLIGTGRMLYSLESNPDYWQFGRTFQSNHHRIRLVDDWSKVVPNRHWSVVLIDQDELSRADTAVRFKDHADYIILHDSQVGHRMGYERIYPHFKYRYDYKACRPWTTVVSNFKEL